MLVSHQIVIAVEASHRQRAVDSWCYLRTGRNIRGGRTTTSSFGDAPRVGGQEQRREEQGRLDDDGAGEKERFILTEGEERKKLEQVSWQSMRCGMALLLFYERR